MLGINFCFLFRAAVFVMAFSKGASSSVMSVTDYFPEINRDISSVTWAHAVNSRSKLQKAIQDPSVMMLEADILIGSDGQSETLVPIMAHPPEKASDLTFAQFLDTVMAATKGGKKKGIKLDFKDFQAVEPCLKTLKARLEEAGAPSFPVFINADVLSGPVNATKTPMSPVEFISLAKKYTPFATLSVGWTTRFGNDNGENIHEGKYSKNQMKEMVKLLKEAAGNPPVFPHITFPVRAGLAAKSIDELLYLQSKVRTGISFTIWSPADDAVNMDALRSLVDQVGKHHCFIDLPFSLDGRSEDHFEQEDEKHHTQSDDHHHEHAATGVSGRVHPENHQNFNHHTSSAPRHLSKLSLIVIFTVGLAAALLAYQRA